MLLVGRPDEDLELGAVAADDALACGIALAVEVQSQPAAADCDLRADRRIILADSSLKGVRPPIDLAHTVLFCR